jgi:antitoxin component of RelBE/YafQ-DinJ toxin-antitoxin module
VRIDPSLNNESKKILQEFGLTQSGYIKLMLKKLINTKNLGIDYSLDGDYREPTETEQQIINQWEEEKANSNFKKISHKQAKRQISRLE